jgi:hypothetical protein
MIAFAERSERRRKDRAPTGFGQDTVTFDAVLYRSRPHEEDMLSAIERLAEVLPRGVLTEAEFSAKKPELLGRI